MKNGLLILLTALLLPLSASAQNHHTDLLFDQYSSVDGATNLNVSGTLASLFLKHSRDENIAKVANSITDIRLLTFSNDLHPDFFHTVSGSLSGSGYTELVRVHNTDDKLLILAEMDEELISELYIIAGGKNNVLIRIRGHLPLEITSEMSGSTLMKIGKDSGIGI